MKWKTRKNDTKKQVTRIEIDDYVLYIMLVTLDTAHFETSLLNADVP